MQYSQRSRIVLVALILAVGAEALSNSSLQRSVASGSKPRRLLSAAKPVKNATTSEAIQFWKSPSGSKGQGVETKAKPVPAGAAQAKEAPKTEGTQQAKEASISEGTNHSKPQPSAVKKETGEKKNQEAKKAPVALTAVKNMTKTAPSAKKDPETTKKASPAVQNLTKTEALTATAAQVGPQPIFKMAEAPKTDKAIPVPAKQAKAFLQGNFLQLLQTGSVLNEGSESQAPDQLAFNQNLAGIQEHVKRIMAYNPSKCLDACHPGTDLSYSACVQGCEKLAITE